MGCQSSSRKGPAAYEPEKPNSSRARAQNESSTLARIQRAEGLVAYNPNITRVAQKESFSLFQIQRAQNLVFNGFSIEQLLKFCDAAFKAGRCQERTTTTEILRDFVIPETADRPRCYMQSEFMMCRGGGQRAEKFVTHTWNAGFVNTVLNILLDAIQKPRTVFFDHVEWAPGRKRRVYAKGILDASFLLEVLPCSTLRKTYWLDIFGLDQHRLICGVCWTCSDSGMWQQDLATNLMSFECRICGCLKVFPCPCGSIKPQPEDPGYELDLLDAALAIIGSLVVSSDADLGAFKRMWGAAAIGQAFQTGACRISLSSDLDVDTVAKLRDRRDVLRLEETDSGSVEDKERVLRDIATMNGGVHAYNQFVNCMMELRFGVWWRLRSLEGFSASAVANLQHLDMDLSWQAGTLLQLTDCCYFFEQLRTLTLICSHCTKLECIDDFANGLVQCQALAHAVFEFVGCRALASIARLGHCLGLCEALSEASFNFRKCKALTNINEFGTGLFQCQALVSANFDFSECSRLTSIDEFGRRLNGSRALTSTSLAFEHCHALEEIDGLGRGLGDSHLCSAYVNFADCVRLCSIDWLGVGLGQCPCLSSAIFIFKNCTAITSIAKFAEGASQSRALTVATFNFAGCTRLTSIDDFGSLGQLQSLCGATFNFSRCAALTSMSKFGKGLGQCKTLTSVDANFEDCRCLLSIDDGVKGLCHCPALTSITLIFGRCSGLASVDGLGKTMLQFAALQSATFDFGECTGLRSIDKFVEGLGQSQTLQSVEIWAPPCEKSRLRDLRTKIPKTWHLVWSEFQNDWSHKFGSRYAVQHDIGGLCDADAGVVRQQFSMALKKNQENQGKSDPRAATPQRLLQARTLIGQGFSVEQLIRFCAVKSKIPDIQHSLFGTTNDVVRDIIIPETDNPPQCYMKSEFMMSLSPKGGQKAEKLVSHAWKSMFANTVMNILMDATERPRTDFCSNEADWGYVGDQPDDWECLLTSLPAPVLRKTYWLCIFAVDEHRSICGDCRPCRFESSWESDPVTHFQADPCRICGKPKRNPCTCGSEKYPPGHEKYEIDLFDDAVTQVDALVVSLDKDLNSLTRVWVVSEIGTAMQVKTVRFRLCDGLGDGAALKLGNEESLMPTVLQCEATCAKDKADILNKVQAMDGGIAAYDQFINTMLELSFGVCWRLQYLRGSAACAAASLKQLEMDLSWKGEQLVELMDCCSFFKDLRTLALNCTGCTRLISIDGFAQALPLCQRLALVNLDFGSCTALASIKELGKGLRRVALEEAALNFTHCRSLTSSGIDELRKCLKEVNKLRIKT